MVVCRSAAAVPCRSGVGIQAAAVERAHELPTSQMISLPLGLAVCGPVFYARLTLTFELQKVIGLREPVNRIRICEYGDLSVWRRMGRVARLGAFGLFILHGVSSCAVGAIQQTVQYVVNAAQHHA